MIIKLKKCDLLFDNSVISLLEGYKSKVKKGEIGRNLESILKNKDINKIKNLDLLFYILQTKRPKIYAESEIKGNGEDWNTNELKILGSICAGFDVLVFDDGKHLNPKRYDYPINFKYIFVPGALLRNDFNQKYAPERDLLSKNNHINENKYNTYYFKKLDSVLHYIDQDSKKDKKKAFVSAPGIGCGQFAAEFKGTLGEKLKRVFINVLEMNGLKYSNIHTLHYDPYDECKNEDYLINGINLRIRPYLEGKSSPQLSIDNAKHIVDFESNCKFYSIVAWDHVSWPGNDFYAMKRVTDDGVKAAASNLMSIITNQEGSYLSDKYTPPEPYINWIDCINTNKVTDFWGSKIQ